MTSSEYEAALSAAQAEYRRNLPKRISEINAVWQQLMSAAWSRNEFETFIRLAHRLAGSGETYGFAKVSRTAHALETYAAALDAGGRLSEAERTQIRRLLADLANAARGE